VLRTVQVMEIWNVNLPDTQNNEMMGSRPAVVLAIHPETSMYVVVPLTKNQDATRFPCTCSISRSAKNCLDIDSVAVVFQIRSISRGRFLHRIGVMEQVHFDRIKTLIKSHLKL
jgi:mRNA-degrading endonuclease toxin of MazEF toxin-antitoxin module